MCIKIFLECGKNSKEFFSKTNENEKSSNLIAKIIFCDCSISTNEVRQRELEN
jgi:hypothetical protein